MAAKSGQESKRRYRKRRRAQLEDETRRRITEATVDLHGTVGPARTTVSAIAERAGVQRATVYRHFPDEESLFGACSAHWLAANPLPDLAEWAEIADPDERLRVGLGELYAWFDRGEYMLEKTTRDAAVVPAMQAAVGRLDLVVRVGGGDPDAGSSRAWRAATAGEGGDRPRRFLRHLALTGARSGAHAWRRRDLIAELVAGTPKARASTMLSS